LLAYKKIIDSLESWAYKLGYPFFSKPGNTSQMGKFKYMKPKAYRSILQQLYVIARRRMDFSEKVPPVLSGLLPERSFYGI